MKKIYPLLVILCLLALKSKSQDSKNELGISLIGINTSFANSCSALYNGTHVRSVLYSKNKNQSFLPKFYFTKQIYNRWKIRFNLEYSWLNNDFNDLVLYDYIYDPFPNSRIIDYRSTQRTTVINIGAQFNIIEQKKLRLYTAVENGITIDNWSSFTKREHLETKNIIGQRFTNRSTFQNQLILIVGGNYFFAKDISLAYEVGVSKNYFQAVSRLSVNYHF